MDTDPYTGETTSTNVSLWDTVSDEKLLKVMKPAYVENLDALVIVTDATNPRSFQCIKQWQADIQEHCTKEGIALPVSIMLANKVRVLTCS